MSEQKASEKNKKSVISKSSVIWENVKIREGAEIGEYVSIGQGTYIGPNVKIGSFSKVQNNSLIYDPAVIEDGVFIGPGVILTNDKFPRAVDTNFKKKNSSDWQRVGVHVKEGASIGAMSVCIAPVIIGKWAVIGAGSVVTKDVRDFALVMGNPAIQIGWVGKAGRKLIGLNNSDKKFICPFDSSLYSLTKEGNLIEDGFEN